MAPTWPVVLTPTRSFTRNLVRTSTLPSTQPSILPSTHTSILPLPPSLFPAFTFALTLSP